MSLGKENIKPKLGGHACSDVRQCLSATPSSPGDFKQNTEHAFSREQGRTNNSAVAFAGPVPGGNPRNWVAVDCGSTGTRA